MSDAATLTLDDYRLRLPSFEGPLDVLLRLIERDRLAITDVSLVAVTAGFFDYVESLADAPPALVAEFAWVAGRLLLLKSRSLLPRPRPEPEEPEPSDLVRQLEALRAVRDAAAALAERDHRGRATFPNGGAIVRPPAPAPRLAIHPPGLLARALRRRFGRSATPEATVATAPAVTVREMIERLLGALRRARVVRFGELPGRGTSRHETIVAFLSLLILLRRKVLEARQEVPFGEIELRLTGCDGAAAPAAAE